MAAVPAYILLALDALINAALTSVFVVLLRPVMRLQDNAARGGATRRLSTTRSMIQMVGWFNMESQDTGSTFWGSRRGILSRNVVGSALISLASAANLTAFFVDQSIQLGYLCLITCTADTTSSSFLLRYISTLHLLQYLITTNLSTVTFSVLVVHWLTLGSPSESEQDLTHSTRQGSFLSTFSSSDAATEVAPKV
jgi:hypothetical protein